MSEWGSWVGGKCGPLRVQFEPPELDFWLLEVNFGAMGVDVLASGSQRLTSGSFFVLILGNLVLFLRIWESSFCSYS